CIWRSVTTPWAGRRLCSSRLLLLSPPVLSQCGFCGAVTGLPCAESGVTVTRTFTPAWSSTLSRGFPVELFVQDLGNTGQDRRFGHCQVGGVDRDIGDVASNVRLPPSVAGGIRAAFAGGGEIQHVAVEDLGLPVGGGADRLVVGVGHALD